MKKLITATDIRNLVGTGQTVLYVGPGTIITPSAKDMAAEHKITVTYNCPKETKAAARPSAEQTAPLTAPANGPVTKIEDIPQHLVAEIVKKVLDSIPGCRQPEEIVKECDPGGIRLVRGNTVKCDTFDTGNPADKVGIKEILTTKESPNMCTGFMTLEDSSFDWTLGYEEIDYIIEGTMDIIINGKTYRGQAGDVFYIPKDSKITFSTPDKCKFFFVTYPANWAELSN